MNRFVVLTCGPSLAVLLETKPFAVTGGPGMAWHRWLSPGEKPGALVNYLRECAHAGVPIVTWHGAESHFRALAGWADAGDRPHCATLALYHTIDLALLCYLQTGYAAPVAVLAAEAGVKASHTMDLVCEGEMIAGVYEALARGDVLQVPTPAGRVAWHAERRVGGDVSSPRLLYVYEAIRCYQRPGASDNPSLAKIAPWLYESTGWSP